MATRCRRVRERASAQEEERSRRGRRVFPPARSYKNCATAASGSPLRFMKLVGLTRMPRPISPRARPIFLTVLPVRPQLCAQGDRRQQNQCCGEWRRIPRPGLPSPATKRIAEPLQDLKQTTNSLLLLFFFRSRRCRSCRGTFAFFLLLANDFRSSGSTFCCHFGGNGLFFNRRRQNGEDGEIGLNLSLSRLRAMRYRARESSRQC